MTTRGGSSGQGGRGGIVRSIFRGGTIFGIIGIAVLAVLAFSTVKIVQVSEGQRGIVLYQGRFEKVQEPGLFFRPLGFFTDVRVVDVTRQTLNIEQNVASSDKQLYDIKVAVDYARATGPEKLEAQIGEVGFDDQKLQDILNGFANDALKSASTQYTLDQVLADRGGLSGKMTELLRPNIEKVYLDLLAVKVVDVIVNEEYRALLEQKANLEVQIESEEKRKQLIEAEQANQDLEALREKDRELQVAASETKIQLEQAQREKQVRDLQGQYWRDNPELLDLRQRELMVQMLSGGNIWFVDPNTDLTLLLNQMSSQGTTPAVIPAPQQLAPGDPEEASPPAQPVQPSGGN
jgi:regulator of protease activity HflC (stomatin/prohibitin superfamily)